MGKYQVKNLIFSSSATVYGNPSTLPITEACPTGNIASPYGWTKYMIEQIITDYAAATLDFSAVIFRYFNPVGAHPSGLIGEAPNGTPNNLMPYITQVAMGKRKQLSVFGADYDTPDGTCIRDYIHIMDIAAGHTAALPFCTSHHGVEVINLGTGMGHSVLELISAFESATGFISLFKSLADVRETSRPALPRQKRQKYCLAGKPQDLCRICAVMHGTGNRKIQMDLYKQKELCISAGNIENRR